MWLIVRQLPVKAGWWEVPPALWVLAVSNLPQFPTFCKNQLVPPAGSLVIPFPIVFTRQFRGNKAEYIWLFWGIKPGLPQWSSMWPPPCYILKLCYKFHRFFHATTTVQGWPWTYSPFQSLHETFFSAPPRPYI